MIDPVLIILVGGSLALGAVAAQIGGPMSWSWRPRIGAIQHRLRCLPRGAPSAAGRAAGMGLLAVVILGGGLAAYAAEPSAPQRLAAQAAGVTGSGDQLSLKLKAPEGERTLKIGETYEDGWSLQALTPTKATLAKDGEVREVGLNPTGAIASAEPAAAPSSVSVAGLPDEATIQAAVNRALAKNPQALERQMSSNALTLEEARRMIVYQGVVGDELQRRVTGVGPAGGIFRGPGGAITGAGVSPVEQRALLGEAAYDDYLEMTTRWMTAVRDQMVSELATRPVSGPTSYYVPAGASDAEAASAQGIDHRGLWTPGPVDAQGGHSVTLIAGTAQAYAARITPPAERRGFALQVNAPAP